ncbi:thioredoxin TrxC [Salipiger mucosus]|nr:thioredoxin TrxC [Salipiger mucosus]
MTKLVCLSCGQTNRFPETRSGAAAKCGVCGDALIDGRPHDVDLATLRKAIRNDGLPLLADFWAPWCGPCRMMAPAFSKAAEALRGQARLVKLDTQAQLDAAAAFGIRGIPTLIGFVGGKEALRQSGALPAAQIAELAGRLRQTA